MKKKVTIDVKGCARCRKNHYNIEFVKLARPVELGELSLTHWAMCPNNKGPILMAFVEKVEEE